MRRLGYLSASLFVLLAACQLFAKPPIASAEAPALQLREGIKLALVGNSLGERMNLYGNFETRLQLRHAGTNIRFRNF